MDVDSSYASVDNELTTLRISSTAELYVIMKVVAVLGISGRKT
jgi:hypothetical protein